MRCVMYCGVQRITPAQQRFKPAKHFAGNAGARHLAVGDIHLDAEVSLNPGDGTQS